MCCVRSLHFPRGPRGFTRQPGCFKNTTKKPREDPRERQKKREWSGRGIKKRKILAHPPFGAAQIVKPSFLAKNGLAKSGQIKMAKNGLAKNGLSPWHNVRLRFAAHWGSWADCLQVVKARHPMISGMMVKALADRSPTIQAVLSCERTLRDSGFDAPNWEDLAEGVRPHQDESQVH